MILPAQLGELFTSPWMLGWLGVAAAPLVIHLLTRRRFREEPWAAMAFLMAAMRQSARRMRIEQLLLLLVRTMIIVLMVLAFARLKWSHAPGVAVTGQPVLKVLVIDRSYSMAYKADDTSRFEKAKAAALHRIRQSRAGDAFLVVLMGEPPEVVVEEPAFFPAENLVAELEDPAAISLEHRGALLADTLTKVHELVAHSLERFPRFATAEVHCFTDLARHTWASAPTDDKKPAGKSDHSAALTEHVKKLRQLTGDRLYLIDVGQDSGENVAVTDVRVVAPYVTVGRPVRIEAKLKNFGGQPRRALGVEVLIDRERVKQFHRDVMAAEEVTLPSFEHTFDTPGDHLIEIHASGDRLSVDDRRWEAIRVEPALRVLCINGRPDSDPLRDATQHLTTALSALDQPDRPPRLQTRMILESELVSSGVELSEYHAVIVSNVAQMSREDARRLGTYVRRGGAIIFFLGDQVRAAPYNRLLRVADGKNTPLLPATVGSVVRGPLRGFELSKNENPITSYFRSQRGPGLSRPLVGGYHKLTVDESANVDVLLAFASGDPAIVSHDVGRGCAVVVATTAAVDPSGETVWSAMPYEKLYVPLIHKILETAVAGQLSHHTFNVGQPLTLNLRTGLPTIEFRLDLDQPDDGPPQKLAVGEYNLDKNAGRWLYGDTHKAGVYRLQIKSPVESRALFAANVETTESDLWSCADQDELPEGMVALGSDEEVDSTVTLESGSRFDASHATLLYAVLGLLLAESLLAWRFSHRST